MGTQKEPAVEELVKRWIEQCVLGLSLCPYARQPWDSEAVRIVLCESFDNYLACIDNEAMALVAGSDETVLIGLQHGLSDFLDFNDFLDDVERKLYDRELEDMLQIASFHPLYRFAGEASDDASNYTNRSPVPIVQLLRVASVAKAVDGGQTLKIPERNMQTLRALDQSLLRELFPWSQH